VVDSRTPQIALVADNEEAEKPHGHCDVAGVALDDGFRAATDAEEALIERLRVEGKAA